MLGVMRPLIFKKQNPIKKKTKNKAKVKPDNLKTKKQIK